MSTRSGGAPLDRNLALELVRVTEAAAMAAGRRMGLGDKQAVIRAAVEAMRQVLDSIAMTATVVIGEGGQDTTSMLYPGEQLGGGQDPQVDVGIDPVDGAMVAAKGWSNAIAAVALAERGAMFDPGPCVYMEKLAVGPDVAGAVELDAPVEANLARIAGAKGERVADLTVCVLDRPRHDELVRRVRRAGARLKLLLDGDVAGAIMTARAGAGVDALVGVGGTAEGVIAACALKCLGGALLGRLYPRNERERRLALERGCDLDQVLTVDDLVHGDRVCFAATGITDGELLRGVRFSSRGAVTHSLSMRAPSGTVRVIEAEHRFSEFNAISRYAAVQGT